MNGYIKYGVSKKHRGEKEWTRVGSYRFLHIAERHADLIEENIYMQTRIDMEKRYALNIMEGNK